ncbi:unnamed protein product [Rodentolepis nana]|uniref:TRAUB domain-containing protein n=1 Tax=Rodentolepis nana TaxID=102285 RepID=A0A0R3TL21_RODNA|nr:unnamed protein product [Rodentolepis nana]
MDGFGVEGSVQVDNNVPIFDAKAKGDVDTRASKGRKIRYLKLPKAVDFMFPEVVSYFSDAHRSNILEQMKTTCWEHAHSNV